MMMMMMIKIMMMMMIKIMMMMMMTMLLMMTMPRIMMMMTIMRELCAFTHIVEGTINTSILSYIDPIIHRYRVRREW